MACLAQEMFKELLNVEPVLFFSAGFTMIPILCLLQNTNPYWPQISFDFAKDSCTLGNNFFLKRHGVFSEFVAKYNQGI